MALRSQGWDCYELLQAEPFARELWPREPQNRHTWSSFHGSIKQGPTSEHFSSCFFGLGGRVGIVWNRDGSSTLLVLRAKWTQETRSRSVSDCSCLQVQVQAGGSTPKIVAAKPKVHLTCSISIPPSTWLKLWAVQGFEFGLSFWFALSWEASNSSSIIIIVCSDVKVIHFTHRYKSLWWILFIMFVNPQRPFYRTRVWCSILGVRTSLRSLAGSSWIESETMPKIEDSYIMEIALDSVW